VRHVSTGCCCYIQSCPPHLYINRFHHTSLSNQSLRPQYPCPEPRPSLTPTPCLFPVSHPAAPTPIRWPITHCQLKPPTHLPPHIHTPSGRNIHALDPYRMPGPAAEARGAAAAQAVLDAHRAGNDGAYPETVAINLWGLDAIKTKVGACWDTQTLPGSVCCSTVITTSFHWH